MKSLGLKGRGGDIPSPLRGEGRVRGAESRTESTLTPTLSLKGRGRKLH